MSVLNVQFGGSHYKGKGIQPVEFWSLMNLNGFQAAVVKYLTRYKEKNGEEDINKLWHFVQLEQETKAERNVYPDQYELLTNLYIRANELSKAEGEFLQQYLDGPDFTYRYDEDFDATEVSLDEEHAKELLALVNEICKEAGYAKIRR